MRADAWYTAGSPRTDALHQAKPAEDPYLSPSGKKEKKKLKIIWLMLWSFTPNDKNHAWLHVLYYYRYMQY